MVFCCADTLGVVFWLKRFVDTRPNVRNKENTVEKSFESHHSLPELAES